MDSTNIGHELIERSCSAVADKQQTSKLIANDGEHKLNGIKSNSIRIQKLSKPVPPQISFLKVPINFENVPYKLQRLYIKYLDLKVANTWGGFKNPFTKKYGQANRMFYRRAIADLIKQDWAYIPDHSYKCDVRLKSYQHVWRSLGIERTTLKKTKTRIFWDKTRKPSNEGFSYFKIEIESLADDRVTYLGQIKHLIQKKMADRRRAQIRYRLKRSNANDLSQATFSSQSAAHLFGYRSPATGSKLRKKFFSVIEDVNSKPYFNQVEGRWKDDCKRIAL